MTFPANAIRGGQPQAAFSGSSGVTLSPDGTRVVYVGQAGTQPRQLYVRPFAEFGPRPLNGTEGATAPFFSPDGESVGFFAAGKLKRIHLADEVITTICDAPEDSGGSGGAWSSDGTIVFAVANIARTGLFRVPARGGTPEALTSPDPNEEGGHGDPSFVDGDRAVLFATRFPRAGVATSIRALVLATKEQRRLVEGASRPRYVPSGHLVYAAGNRLMAAPFDPDRLALTGSPATIIEAVDTSNFAVSRAGTLVYHPPYPSGGRPVWVDRRGSIEPIPLDEDRAVGRPRLSPDGSRAVMEVWRELRSDIAVFQFNNGVLTFLTSDGSNNSPSWHPDGRRVVYRRGGSLYVQTVDGGAREVFLDAADPGLKGTSQLAPGVFTRDGSIHAFVVHGSRDTAADIWTMRAGAKPVMSGVVQRPGNQWGVRISPDGQWISYASDESGQFEIWVEPIAGGGARYQVSRAGGREAVWSSDGAELFYRSGDRLLAVPVSRQPGSPTGVPQVLFTGQFVSTDIPDYDVSRDGKRFFMLRPIQDDVESQTLRVVDNWFEDLRRLAPTGGQ
jgi:serine/threonine-protein kinase